MRVVSLIVLISLFLMGSCSSARMHKLLLYHSAQMDQLVERDLAVPDKMDVLAVLMVEALEESLQFKKAKDSVKFLKSYTKENKSSIDALYHEFSNWYKGLNSAEKLIETARIARKPYVRQVLSLYPKVEKKINRKLSAVFVLTKFVKLFKIL